MTESKQQRIERLNTKALWMRLDLIRKRRAEKAAADHELIAKLDHEKAIFEMGLAEQKKLAAEEEYLAARLEGDVQ